jgi:hypothetical protein
MVQRTGKTNYNIKHMSRSIKVLCINDKGRPQEIPADRWIVEGTWYHITHIYLMLQQRKIQGCELAEFDISDCIPYNCYRLDRFGIREGDLQKLFDMIRHCSTLNTVDLDMEKLTRGVEIIKK